MDSPTADQQLDVKGLNCPLPILRAKIVLKGMREGQVLSVLTTDPYSLPDFRAFCEHTGNEILRILECEECIEFIIRRAQT